MAAVLAENCGVSNIGIEGIMLISALVAVIVSALTGSAFWGLAAAVGAGVAVAFILAYFIFHLKTHFVLSGLSINMFAKGATILMLFFVTGSKGTSTTLASKTIPDVSIPFIKEIPIVGKIVSDQNILTYIAFLITGLLSYYLYETKSGLRIRAVGANPEAAASVGVSVAGVRYKAFLLSGVLSGIAGAYLTMGYMNTFTANMTAGRGFIALAACSMGHNSPWATCFAALLFGTADALSSSLQTINFPTQFVQMIPYVITIIGIMLYSIKAQADQHAVER